MSDPVTNVEVEDVLSSIRRLVSEDKRPASAVETAVAQDRLVLTPALRITDEDADEADDTSDVDVLDVLQDAQSLEPETAADDDDSGDAHDDVQSVEAEAQVDKTDALILDAVWTPEEDEAVAPADADGDDHLSGAEAEADTSDADDVWNEAETDSPDDTEVSAFFEGTEVNHVADAASDEDGSEYHEAAEPVEAEAVEIEPPSQAETLSSKIAALEAVIGKREDQWEPDQTGDSDYSGTDAAAMAWEDSAADMPEVEDPYVAPAESGTLDVEDILDEEMLRDMVSDIVRQELQGALGERITRNVRKLVRREIHRALAAQELD